MITRSLLAIVIMGLFLITAFTDAGTLNGRVVKFGTTSSVPAAFVVLQPDAGGENISTTSDLFGMFSVEDIPAGTYDLTISKPGFNDALEEDITFTASDSTNRIVELSQIAGKIFIDLVFHVNCLQTNSNLPGATITVERRSSLGGAVDPAPFSLVSDTTGQARLTGVESGFFSISISKTGWKTFSFPDMPTQYLSNHSFAARLVPELTTLSVSVNGIDPKDEEPREIKPLKDVLLELTALDLVSDNELSHPLEILLGEATSYTFNDLAPVRYRLRVKKFGYLEHDSMDNPFIFETTITPTDATLPDQDVTLSLANTKLKIMLTSGYKTDEFLEGAEVKIEGYKGDATEGIARMKNTEVDDDGNISTEFEEILPGKYWLHIAPKDGQANVPIPDDDTFPFESNVVVKVNFAAKQSFADVIIDKTEAVEITLDPIPALLVGRLIATDHLSDPFSISQFGFHFPHDFRIMNPKQDSNIRFVEKEGVDFLPDDKKITIAESGEDGFYTVRLLPGVYGIQLPDQTNYLGHNLTIKDIGDAGNSRFSEPGWPYPIDFPYTPDEFGHYIAFISFDSGDEKEVDMWLHRHNTTLINGMREKTDENTVGAPTHTAILNYTPAASLEVTTPYNDLLEFGVARLNGGQITNREIRPENVAGQFIMNELIAGNYSLEGEHPRYTFETKNFEIAPWNAPGELPPIRPAFDDDRYFFPGISHFVDFRDTFKLEGVYNSQGFITVTTKVFNANADPPRYDNEATNYNRVYFQPNWSQVSFKLTSPRTVPAGGSYTLWYEARPGQWYVDTGSGPGDNEFEVFIGGPSGNITGANVPPFVDGSYEIEVHVINFYDRREEITNVTGQLSNNGGNFESTGDPDNPVVITTVGGPTAEYETISHPQWGGGNFEPQQEHRFISINPPRIRLDIFVEKELIAEGKIVEAVDGNPQQPVEGAVVEVIDRHGNLVLGQVQTGSDGTFSIPNIKIQPFYVNVKRLGFLPFRKRFVPPAGTQNFDTGILTITRVPPPIIDEVKLNRFGMFLPGVLKSGDATQYDVNNGRANVTVTWIAKTRPPATYMNTIEDHDDENDVVISNTAMITDRILGCVLVDQRTFNKSFINNPSEPQDNFIDEPRDIIDFYELLNEIQMSKHRNDNGDEEDFFVVFSEGNPNTPPVAGSPVNYKGQLKLYEMPAGKPHFVLFCYTEKGGLARIDYTTPSQEKDLEGVRLPSWGHSYLNFLGYSAYLSELGNLSTEEKGSLISFPLGKVSFTPQFDSGIDLENANLSDPDFVDDEKPGYITYAYQVGASISNGTKGPTSSMLSVLSRRLGLSVTGASNLTLIGKAEELKYALKGIIKADSGSAVPQVLQPGFTTGPPVFKPDPEANSLKGYTPGFLKKLGFELEALTVTLKTVGTHTLFLGEGQQHALENGAIPEMSYAIKGGGFIRARFAIELTPLFSVVPSARFVLEVLSELDIAKLVGFVDAGFGGSIERENITLQNRIGGTVVPGTVPTENDILGREVNRTKVAMQILGGFGGGLRSVVLDLSLSAQVGPPKDTVGQDGVKITFGSDPSGPTIKRVVGAANVVFEPVVKLAGVKYGRSYTWEIARLEYPTPELSTAGASLLASQVNIAAPQVDPVAPHVDIVDIGPPEIEILPSQGSEINIIDDDDGHILNGLYDNEQFAISAGDDGVILVTSVNQNTGLMEIKMLIQDENGNWIMNDTVIGTAAYIMGLDVVQMPNGNLLAVWVAVDQADLGNPFTGTKVFYSVSSGTPPSFGTPIELAPLDGVGSMPMLSIIDDRILLTLLHNTNGPVSTNQLLLSAIYNNDTEIWDPSLSSASESAESIVEYATAVNPNTQSNSLAIIVHIDEAGNVFGRTWNGTAFSVPRLIGEGLSRDLDIAFHPDGVPFVAGVNSDTDQINLFFLDSDSGWQNVTPSEPISSSAVQDILLAVVDNDGTPVLCLIWSQGGMESRLHHAFVEKDGTVIQNNALASLVIPGLLEKISLRRTKTNGNLEILATASGNDDVITLMDFEIGQDTLVPDGPTIITEPVDTSVTRGANLELTVEATGMENLTYQWLKDSIELPGETSPTLVVTSADESDAGLYTTLVTDKSGTTATETVEVSVTDDYVIQLEADWNLIGLPVEVTETVRELFEDENGNLLISESVWVWDNLKRRFNILPMERIPPSGVGFWVFSETGGATGTFTGTTTAIGTDFPKGWNAFSPTKTGPIDPNFQNSNYIFEYNKSGNKITDPENLKLLKGYWIFKR